MLNGIISDSTEDGVDELVGKDFQMMRNVKEDKS
jgi:hypothetical protein